MIIHDPEWEATLNVTQQIPVSMSDWYHEQMPTLLDYYMGVDNINGDIPPPNSFLCTWTLSTTWSFNEVLIVLSPQSTIQTRH
jgi:iron transport multicopper oxidase